MVESTTSCNSTVVAAGDDADTITMSLVEELVISPNAAVIPDSAAFAQVSVTVRESESELVVFAPVEQAASVKAMSATRAVRVGTFAAANAAWDKAITRYLFLV